MGRLPRVKIVASQTLSQEGRTVSTHEREDERVRDPETGLTETTHAQKGSQHATGIIMLTSSLSLVHMSARAFELSRRINTHSGKGANGMLPSQVLHLCMAVKRHGGFQMAVATVGDDHGRVPGGDPAQDAAIVLYGFEIPGGIRQPMRVLILMKEVREGDWPALQEAVERFCLTRREETVIRQLALGYTNKEIASVLRIAEQTVKEHIKHLMIKTGASTRTGLLARILATTSRMPTEFMSPTRMAG
jgi:DNA-binding CsgD family transcriptional regulator